MLMMINHIISSSTKLFQTLSRSPSLPRSAKMFQMTPSSIYIRNYSTPNIPISFTRSEPGEYTSSRILRLGKLNHVAIATPDLEKSVRIYGSILGATVSLPQDLPSHGVTTVFVELANTKIELLHPLGPNSPIQKFLEKNRDGGIHHICIEVKDIRIALESLKDSKAIRVLDPEPKIGAHGKLVVFLHPKDCGGVLVELEEE